MDIIVANNELKAKAFLQEIEGKNPLFIATVATTETGKIPGLSAAGANPDFTDFTPPADAELLLLGKCKSIQGVPITPDGIPTPALITTSALHLADIPVLIVDGGVKVKPQVPYIDVNSSPGRDIRSGDSVDNVEEVIERAKVVGEHLAKASDYLVIGESIPGGTTTALGVLSALNVDAQGKVSSTLPDNPHGLKAEVVATGLGAAAQKFGNFRGDPIKAISAVGDPMMAAVAGLVIGGSHQAPVLMAGGTQMTAVLAVINALEPNALCNIAIGTTRWVTQDLSSDICGIVKQFCDVPIIAADLDFGSSKYPGLQIYETGLVKEGVGAGGASIAAMAKSGGAVDKQTLLKEIERNYASLMQIK
ncbi:nicotinate mononucleotide-dependent phosphoribosyltransferase CobT [Candidatus Bathycorpusculum sp.]|uniref:nicotinate mononucleotide-dependent phosphoribosyltransferase CobT n=1 Tax=Candidatus Bathycorpusculum sp. TaxID=2994959 RepID=UPI00283528D9|nr:TIGR00303 family protein [Candidatus Termitimicrobium sp.]MCL2431182.1 TIGR00303 family protein [Candidatus Termitimicrobium sp.]